MRVIGVCSRSAHGVGKTPREEVRLIEGIGVEGDAHAGATVKHRSRVAKDPSQPNLRQVHLIRRELLEALRAAGFPLEVGQMGENILTEGLDLLALSTGARLYLGEACVELTGLRNPCVQLEGVHPGLMAAVLVRDSGGALIRKAGVMGVVLRGGLLRPGDPIRVEPPAQHTPMQPV